MKKFFKTSNILIAFIFIFAFAILVSPISAAVANTPRPCPNTNAPTGSTINDTSCVECDLFGRCGSTGGIDVSNFFPKISPNDLIGTISTILLAVIIILFVFKIIFAGFKWVNNDAQDKSKKEAIKSITNGVIGIVIAFAAYFVVILAKSIFGLGGTEQLVNCSNIYYSNYDAYQKNVYAPTLSATTEEFQRCAKLSGKESALDKSYSTFANTVQNNCGKYFTFVSNTNGSPTISFNDKQKLNECFINELNKLP